MTRWLLVIAFAMQPLLACGAPQVLASGEYKIYMDDTPRWVKTLPQPPLSGGASGTDAATIELLDTQVAVLPGEVTAYRRLISHVLNQVGADGASHLQIPFIPDFETLTVHGVWVTRANDRVSRLDASSIRLAATEPDLDRRIYRGVVTAAVFIKDLRPGDVLEISYSISGSNPVLGEHLLGSFPLALPVPVKLLHARLFAPTDRRFDLKSFNSAAQPVVRAEAGYTDTTLLLRDVPKYEAEPRTPPESSTLPFAQFSDFHSWAEVNDWAQTLFTGKGKLPAELQGRVQEWQAQSRNPQDAARLALDYVQKEIRYVAVALGESTLRPAAPEDVVRRGFGDCKDKSLLLATLLRSMGIPATPALVSTKWEGTAFDMLPSVEPLDHAIVMAEIDGQKYWLDGTLEYQAGPLSARFAGSYGKALVVGREGYGVEAVSPPAGYSSGRVTTHRFVVRSFAEPVDLFIQSSDRGIFADLMRVSVQSDRGAVEREALERYRRLYPSIRLADGLQAATDERTGELNAGLHFVIPDFFEYREGVLKGRVVAAQLWLAVGSIEPRDRKAAYRLRYPESIVQDIVIEFPESVPLTSAEPISIEDDYLACVFRKRYEDPKLLLHFECKTLAPSVPANAIASHRELRKRITEWLAVQFRIPTGPADLRNAGGMKPPGSRSASVAEALLAESAEQERTITADIGSGRLSEKQLSHAYLSRAWVREQLGRYEAALEDGKRALELDPTNADAAETIAVDLRMLRRFDEARQQYQWAAEHLHGHYGLHQGRGQLSYYAGRFAEAQADFRRAVELAKEDDAYQHALIWLFLASARMGGDPKAEVEPYLDAPRNSWPAPAARLLAGRTDVQSVLEAARDADEKTALKRLCEAQFFIGEYYLIQGDVAKANQAFEEAVATGVRQYVEYVYAQWELQRTAASR